MNSRTWTGIAISLILGSFIVFAFLSRKPVCIDSRFVERIDRVGTTGSASVYRCALHKSVPYDEKWFQSQAEVSRRIQRVERFIESIAPYDEKVRVTIFEQRPATYKVVGHDIYLGEDLFNVAGPLEKGLLKVWFREKANALILDHPLIEESITDLLDFAIQGRLDIVDPLLQIPLGSHEAKWPFVAMTLSSYCQSEWRQAEHFQFCSSLTKSENKSLVSASLRPLLTQVWIEAFLKLKQDERRQFLAAIPNFLQSLDFEDSGVGFTSLEESQQSLVDLSSELSGLLRNMERHTVVETQTSVPSLTFNPVGKWVGLVRGELNARGFSEQPLDAQVDLMVVLKDFSGEKFFAEPLWQRSTGKSILGYDHESLYLLPNIEGLQKNMLGKVLAQTVLFVYCGALTVSDLEPFFDKTTHVLAVHSCDQELNWRLDGLLAGDIDKLARQNPELKFMDLHMPSLALALKLRKVDSQQKISLLADASHEFIRQRLGWKSSEFDKNLNMYKVESDIEAIRAYRP